ncbi:MAG: hypothetical protein JWO94_1270 [Verrucomicrobiaceae bacterium]|nr:hypothetical protein [Verrucomicrobiaceae bacterium]
MFPQYLEPSKLYRTCQVLRREHASRINHQMALRGWMSSFIRFRSKVGHSATSITQQSEVILPLWTYW